MWTIIWIINIYLYLDTCGSQSSNLYLNVVDFSTPELGRHLWQLKTIVFLHWCLICAVLLKPLMILYGQNQIAQNFSFVLLPKYFSRVPYHRYWMTKKVFKRLLFSRVHQRIVDLSGSEVCLWNNLEVSFEINK